MSERELYWRPAPTLLLGAGLLLWGWQNNFLPYAILMGILLEMAHRVSWRWPVTDREFNNLTDISGLGFFIIVVYVFLDKGAVGIYTILSLMPFILFLLVAVQQYSEQGAIKASALFISLRKLEPEAPSQLNRHIDISLPYFIICIISASAGNNRTIWFFLLCCLLISITLWFQRPLRRYRITTWALLLLLSFSIAYGLQYGIRYLQAAVEQNFISMFDNFMWRYRDPDRATTAIGTLGRLQFSDRILLRINTDRRLREPLYLIEASYNSYNYGVWSAVNPVFESVDSDPAGGAWTLNSGRPDRNAEISVYLVKQAGVIPLPEGTNRISGAGIVAINRNNYGTIKMEMHKGWVRYTTAFQDHILNAPPPNDYDLSVKDSYRADFERYADELHLRGMTDRQAVAAITSNFLENYRYSLTRRQQFPRGRYLADFLFNSKSGHCEFFATATVLLLRTLGIPARYAVGYATDEYSVLEGQYLARSRDAHSWALAFIDGRWIRVDTTPAVWAAEGEQRESALQPFLDLFSWINYRISRWRSGDEPGAENDGYSLLWLLLPLGLLLFWRLYFKERISRKKVQSGISARTVYPGQDSVFYRVIERLEHLGYARLGGETLLRWAARMDHLVADNRLMRAAALHYRYRFDPAGLRPASMRELEQLVSQLLVEIRTDAGGTGDAGKRTI